MSEVIRLLPDHIANQIAAGEVIQRPASVVKELLENALDADATSVELHVKDAGKTLIQVVDNGKGMSAADARMAFERHATSKVSCAEDLFQLTTKGFRGEALASIAAIAHVELKTKEADSEVGQHICIEGSKLVSQEEIVCKTGSSFIVKNLFFNVPARRNFLKTDKIETKHIYEEFLRVAFTHPEVRFLYVNNDKVVENLNAGNHRQRIADIHGAKYNEGLVPIEEETDIVGIKGFICKPEFARKTKGNQYFFVNNRYFKHSYFHHAVSAAFENVIPKGMYPTYYLFLDVNPQAIDVNVHPTKTEIKFEEEKFIYSILRSAVKQSLGKYNVAATLDFEPETTFDIPYSMSKEDIKIPEIKINPEFNPFNSQSNGSSSSSKTSSSSPSNSNAKSFAKARPTESDWENYYDVQEEKSSDSNPTPLLEEESIVKTSNTNLFHGKYIFVQTKNGIMLIDIRRANERVLYDELMSQFMLAPIASQQLLFPLEIDLTKKEKMDWEDSQKSLNRIGFTWDWRETQLIIVSIPSFLNDSTLNKAVENIITKLSQPEIDKGEIAHELILSLSRAASMSYKKQQSQEELNHVIERLFECKDHMYTPNGNKIIDTLSLDELQNRF